MFDDMQSLFGSLGLLFNAIALGAAWVVTIASPNCSFDKLDGSRADRHVRELLHQTATPLAGLMLVAGAFFLLGGGLISGIVALVAAFGFLTNRWTLAPRETPNKPGVKTSRKAQRGMSVSLTLIFALVAVASAAFGLFGL